MHDAIKYNTWKDAPGVSKKKKDPKDAVWLQSRDYQGKRVNPLFRPSN